MVVAAPLPVEGRITGDEVSHDPKTVSLSYIMMVIMGDIIISIHHHDKLVSNDHKLFLCRSSHFV